MPELTTKAAPEQMPDSSIIRETTTAETAPTGKEAPNA